MKLMIDIDDVLFPWWDTAHAICEAAGITNGVVPSSWTCHEDYGCTIEEWLEVLAVATRDGRLYAGAPYPGAVDDSWKNVQALTAAGVPTWLVDAPHNQDADHPTRVPSIVEFAEAILALKEAS